MANTSVLFQPIKVGGTWLKNRIIMPSMATNFSSKDGSFTRKHYGYYVERARGGVGLIITEAMPVRFPYGANQDRFGSIIDGKQNQEWYEVNESIHSFGAKIIAQIYDAGFLAFSGKGPEAQALCPIEYAGAKAVSKEEIVQLKAAFVNAAKNAVMAGFDGVELHASHMYIINEFLSPITNQRTDEYGGSIENRFRLLGELIGEIKAVVPASFIVSVRLAMIDLIPGGITIEMGQEYAKMCEAAGADMLNISMGFYTKMYEGAETQWEPEGVRVYQAEAAKKVVNIPVCAVGKLRSPDYVASLVEDGVVDMVVLGRNLICDPQWPNKVMLGKENEIRGCLNCLEGCMGQFVLENSIRCVINPWVGFEDMIRESSIDAAGVKKNIAVVGGGVAGMQFAIIASRRGHNVTIIEKADVLGGQAMIASLPPHKHYIMRAVEWFRGEVERAGVKVVLGTEADVDYLKTLNADLVVVATGSVPNTPPIKGIEKAVVSWDVLTKEELQPEGKKIVVIGGGIVGAELSHLLCLKNNQVNILEMLPEMCNGHDIFHKDKLMTYLGEHAEMHTSVCVEEICDGKVVYTTADGEHVEAEADMVVYCTGHKPYGTELYDALIAQHMEAYKLGDVTNPAKIRMATRAACDLAYRV